MCLWGGKDFFRESAIWTSKSLLTTLIVFGILLHLLAGVSNEEFINPVVKDAFAKQFDQSNLDEAYNTISKECANKEKIELSGVYDGSNITLDCKKVGNNKEAFYDIFIGELIDRALKKDPPCQDFSCIKSAVDSGNMAKVFSSLTS